MNKDKIIIYTDGGCRHNPGIGGWGAFLSYGNKQKKIYGCEKKTTNNRMELTAVIEALKLIKSNKIPIAIYSDSKYVLNGINNWLANWKQKNWRTAQKKPVKNADLWQTLDSLVQNQQINWHWVKGHSGNTGNEIADALTNVAMDSCTQNKD